MNFFALFDLFFRKIKYPSKLPTNNIQVENYQETSNG